jgi:hypothetical protein
MVMVELDRWQQLTIRSHRAELPAKVDDDVVCAA